MNLFLRERRSKPTMRVMRTSRGSSLAQTKRAPSVAAAAARRNVRRLLGIEVVIVRIVAKRRTDAREGDPESPKTRQFSASPKRANGGMGGRSGLWVFANS